MARPFRLGPGFAVYLTFAVISVGLGILSAPSIGILTFLPVGVVMLLAIAFWQWPAVVAAIVTGAIALSLGYLTTAPFRCFQRSTQTSGQPVVVERGCSRLLLPDIQGDPQTSHGWLALGIGGGAAVVFGSAAGLIARAVARRAAPPTAASGSIGGPITD